MQINLTREQAEALEEILYQDMQWAKQGMQIGKQIKINHGDETILEFWKEKYDIEKSLKAKVMRKLIEEDTR